MYLISSLSLQADCSRRHGACAAQRGDPSVRVVKLSKSGGVVTRPAQLRKVCNRVQLA